MKFSSNQHSKYSAFTLIEFLIVAFIIVVLSVILLANYEWGGYQSTLKRSAHQVAGDLRRVEGLALSPEPVKGEVAPSGYGVYFDIIGGNNKDHYILFADRPGVGQQNKYDEGEELETIYLPENVLIEILTVRKKDDLVGSKINELSIVFIPPDPIVKIEGWDPYIYAIITLRNEKTNEQIKVTVNKTGLIEIGEPSR